MRHLHLTVVKDCHAGNLAVIPRVAFLDLQYKTAVDLIHDLVDSRKQPLKNLNRPFFQCFRHDRMVGVGTGLRGNLPRLVPAETFLIHKNTHQLCHRHRRVCVVQLERHLLRQSADVIMILLVTRQRTLYTRGYEEILLL